MDKKVIMHKKSTFGIALFLGLVLCACSCKTISLEVFTHPYNLNQVPTYKSPNKFYSYLQADTEGDGLSKYKSKEKVSSMLNYHLNASCRKRISGLRLEILESWFKITIQLKYLCIYLLTHYLYQLPIYQIRS